MKNNFNDINNSYLSSNIGNKKSSATVSKQKHIETYNLQQHTCLQDSYKTIKNKKDIGYCCQKINKDLAETIDIKKIEKFHSRLIATFEAPVYRSWLSFLVLDKIENLDVTFVVSTSFKATIINQRYMSAINNIWQEVFFKAKSIVVKASAVKSVDNLQLNMSINNVVKQDSQNKEEKNFLPKGKMKGSFDINKLCTPINNQKTFANFLSSASNSLARSACVQVSKKNDVGPLYLFGLSGCGKTHLLNAIGNEFLINFPNAKVVYATHDTFTNSYVDAHLSSDMRNFLDTLNEADIFIIDDIHLLASRRGSQKCLVQVIEYMISHNKPMVIAGSTQSSGLLDIGLSQRLVSRLRAGLCVRINDPSDSLREKMLRKFLCDVNVNQFFPKETIKEIVATLDGSMREVEGAAKILILHVNNNKKILKVADALEILNQQFGIGHKKISLEQIVDKVVDIFGVSHNDIKSKRRLAVITRARHAAALIAKELTDCPYGVIGAIFNRDHSTIVAGVRRAEDLERTDQIFAKKIAQIRLYFS